MAQSKSVNILSARSLLNQRSSFQFKFWNGFNASRKAAHIAITTAQDQYDKRLKTLQDELIKRTIKLAGDKDIVQDPALLKSVTLTRAVDEVIDGKPTFKYNLCQLEQHIALALARNPDFLSEPLSQENWVSIAEQALGETLKSPTETEIDKVELELAALDDLLDQLKHNKYNEKLKPYVPHDINEAELTGVKTYEVHEYQQGEVIDVSKGMSQEQINRHSEAYGKRSGIKPMGRKQAEQLMRDSTRDLSGKAGSQNLNKPPMSPSEMALHIYRQSGVVPDGYQVENDSTGQRLVKL